MTSDAPIPEPTNRSSARTQPRPWRHLHASTYVVLVLTATVLALVNVPGQFVPYLDFGGLDQYCVEFTLKERLEHGWPWPYLLREEGLLLSPTNLEIPERPSPWSMTKNVTDFRPSILAADVAIVLLLLGALGAAFEYWRRQRNHLFQFQLSDVLVGIALMAVGMAYAVHVAREYRQERAALMQLGPRPLTRDPNAQELTSEMRCTYYRGLSWLRGSQSESKFTSFNRIVAIDLYDPAECEHAARLSHLKVVNLHVSTPPAEYRGSALLPLASLDNLEALRICAFSPAAIVHGRTNYTSDIADAEIAGALRELRTLPRLMALDVSESDVGDLSAAEIGKFAQLEELDLRHTNLSDEGLEHIGKMESLNQLRVGGLRASRGISNRGLRHLANLRLQRLMLYEIDISDEGLEHVGSITELTDLDLGYTSVEGPGLVHLQKLTRLRILWLPDRIDRSAASRLQEKLPQVQISYGRAGLYLIGRHQPASADDEVANRGTVVPVAWRHSC